MATLTDFAEHGPLILLSNREPYEHIRRGSTIEVRQPAGGLVSALDPTMRRTSGIWVAWGSGSADRETSDERGRVRVPPDDPSYTLHRVWLEDEHTEGYYQGFANSALWPLCHMLIQHFQFRSEHWKSYRAVNERFALAVAEEADNAGADRAMVWIHDYHFGLVPAMLHRLVPKLFIHQFWHIPFPPPDLLRLLPVQVHDTLLRGLLGNDLLEFHTERYAVNFIDCVAAFVPEARVSPERLSINYEGRTISVGAFPISIDFERYESLALAEEGASRASLLRERYARDGRQLGVCVDRTDYTKGIPERLRALELLWTEHPELRSRVTFIVVATPSRSELEAYRTLESEVVSLVMSINEHFGTADWTPIVLINENIDAELLAGVYRAGDLCLVSSLQDGMNLVAKEFIACQTDERGVLVLSRFTGAAEEIDDAVLINPFNVDGFMAGIVTALRMPADERRRRMRRMRERIRRATIFDWLETILMRARALMEKRSGARV
ncbi:MAG TPA: trehalose-6-phosphate synthase [Gemmatimonadaceae bacterium]|nr:trehalose-6-phosphate synthase [Gemmatimonadaceae bacterium]